MFPSAKMSTLRSVGLLLVAFYILYVTFRCIRLENSLSKSTEEMAELHQYVKSVSNEVIAHAKILHSVESKITNLKEYTKTVVDSHAENIHKLERKIPSDNIGDVLDEHTKRIQKIYTAIRNMQDGQEVVLDDIEAESKKPSFHLPAHFFRKRE